MTPLFKRFGLQFFIFSFFFMTSCKDKNKNTNSHNNIETTTVYQCPMDCEHGKTYGTKASCPVCEMNLKALGHGHSDDCSCLKDGKCQCVDGKCSCKDCPEHGTKTSCTFHKDGNCKCEGDKCAQHS